MPQLDNLGLKENPFKNNTDHRFFYSDQNRAQILESTEHLIEYSSNLQVILGLEGMGKSHLLETLSNRLDNNWRIATIKDVEQYDTLALIQATLDAFGAIPEPGLELLEALETQLAEIIQLGFKPVLFIDDAQALSVDSIRFLVQLSQQKQNDEPYINIVLFSTMEITENLQSPELKDYRDIIHIATLNNLDKEGVSGYLRHKLAVAGFNRESPFTPRIIDSIFNDSNGIPEKINFYANKFLVSSGKGEDYIEPNTSQSDDENSPAQDSDFISALNDDDLKADKTDRAEDQINRLAEQFDEIEKMSEQPEDDFFIDKDSMEQVYDDQIQEELFENNELKKFDLPKVIIPVAIVGIVLVALVVLNTVFDQPEQTSDKTVVTENIELLPLELPAEKSIKPDKSIPSVNDAQLTDTSLATKDFQATTNTELVKASLLEKNIQQQALSQPVDEHNSQQSESNDPDIVRPEIVKVITTETTNENSEEQAEQQKMEKSQLIKTDTVNFAKKIEDKASQALNNTEASVLSIIPELRIVEPEPVIGSNRRQTITIIGHQLDKDTTLIMKWADKSKEFSAITTPQQWTYVSQNKIKLHLTTGIESQQWQVFAKNKEGQESETIAFDVVKPFIANMAIKSIVPNPLAGSDKRQTLTIKGQGFTRQTVIELKWDKNSKHFSTRLSPNQFEYISANEIKLFITTGLKERKWNVIAKKANSNQTSSSFFNVVTQSANNTPITKNALRNIDWIKQQANDNYTIQLFGSYNRNAIDDLIKKYSLKGELAWFETKRNGQNWYSMTYGNFKSRELANAAINSINAKLTNPKPWIRSFGSIKDQLGKPTAKSKPSVEKQTASDLPESVPETMNEAWIWTQSPTDYTVQLLALSTEKAIKDYAKKHQVESQSVHFKFKREGKILYALIYGSYSDKKSAEDAKQQLVSKIKGSKPWVRSFSEIHGLISP